MFRTAPINGKKGKGAGSILILTSDIVYDVPSQTVYSFKVRARGGNEGHGSNAVPGTKGDDGCCINRGKCYRDFRKHCFKLQRTGIGKRCTTRYLDKCVLNRENTGRSPKNGQDAKPAGAGWLGGRG